MAIFLGLGARANEVASADLRILGLSLEVDPKPVATGVDIPGVVQTIFGGKTNDDAPAAEGLVALGELTGPGVDTPITLNTKPGHPFVLPALHEKGEYTLQNIRLANSDGQFLQQAVPSFAVITVTDTLTSQIKVVQLTPDQLRERGITVDPRNFDVYEYTFIFAVEGKSVQIPYPVIIDRRTQQIITPPGPNDYKLPSPPTIAAPPRFQPPATVPLTLFEDVSGGGGPEQQSPDPESNRQRRKPTIPAAIVIPTGFGVLHQFFAVILQVSNAAPPGTEIKLDSITATLDAPLTLRVAKTTPAVSFGQPLPIYDKASGATFLVAGANGSGEWSLEALKAGTHTVTIDVKATYKNVGQPDIALHGSVSSSIVVSDPRFHITFSHPDTIRRDEPYTAYAFITNLSAQAQTIHLDTREILKCGEGYTSGVCRNEGDGITDLTLQAGQMTSVPYKLKSQIDGHIYAAAGSASDEAIGVDVKLTMGVSASGIPLSPATLLMPYYARYIDPAFIDANMQLLGIGYSLATAPLNAQTAKFPRVLKGDVFERAQEITRAGQRIFITRRDPAANDAAENRDSFFNLSLDLLDNVERIDRLPVTPELAEWDQLRRSEDSGRRGGAAMARQLETNGLTGGKTIKQFVDDFAAATSHRSPYALALVHGSPVSGSTRPYAMSVSGAAAGHVLDVPAEAASGWKRDLPFAELAQFNSSSEAGELALIGRWKENLFVSVLPASDHFTLDLIYPQSTTSGGFIRASIDITGAHLGSPVSFAINSGSNTIVVNGGTPSFSINNVTQTPLRAIAAAQDLHLDDAGHIVSLLFNRPISVADASNFRDSFSLTTSVNSVAYSITRKNTAAKKYIPGAALQDDGRIVNVSFDKALSTNATYNIGIDPITDLVVPSNVMGATSIVPRVDNNRPGGLVYGKVLAGDNTELPNVQVQLLSDSYQYDTTLDPHGQFLFEYVARDIDRGIQGNYTLSASLADGKYTEVKGTVRLPGQVQTVNLVFLGRGRAQGQVRYSDGVPLDKANVVVTSPVFHDFKSGITDANGNYSISDLPVGPLTFLVSDPSGRVTYATNQIRTPGEIVTQDLVIQKKDFPGTGTVRVTVRRSDFAADDPRGLVANAHVGVYTQGYGLTDGYTDANGRFEFTKIPAGFISILAAEFNITRESAGVDMDLRPDTSIDTVLTLHVPTAADQSSLVTLQGTITRDDPTAPLDTTKDQVVGGAVLNISGLEGVTADGQGNFTFPSVPISFSAKAKMSVFDPTTGRRGSFVLPTLVAGVNQFSVKLQSSQPQGLGTLRVRVFGAKGEPATGMRVIWPGYPPNELPETTPGVYEVKDVQVPSRWDVWAIPNTGAAVAKYGEQLAHGTVRVDFDGQVGILDLRLPGQGTVFTTIEVANSRAFGRVDAVYPVWDEAEQGPTPLDHLIDMNQETNVATIKIPANVPVLVETVDHPAGYASANVSVGFEGDTRNVALKLSTLGDVTGRVLMPDGQTPVSGASVRFFGSAATLLPVQTLPDGSFKFNAAAANQSFHILAEVTQDGIYRTGYVDGRTPTGGGPVSNLVLILREQSSIEGTVKDTSGVAVPLAKYWVRELWWPYRTFGSQTDPLIADKSGHFIVGNLFTGPFRITAVSPEVQEIRGDYQGQINLENDNSQRSITVTVTGLGGGTGSITVVVQNPQDNFARVANAEVSLLRNNQGFDFATTDANGVATFDLIPISGNYAISAFSKALGRAGGSGTFTVALNQTTNVTVTLEFRGTVTGTLTDPESEPVANAPVKGSPVTLHTGTIATRASTDGTGAFQFLGIPEGGFSLEAYDLDSGRKATGPPNLFISKLFQESHVDLQLERTATLHVTAYLPNDAGGAGVLAPLVNVKVTQNNYSRELQGNNLDFKKMFSQAGYSVVVTELGGENRQVKVSGGFGGALSGNVSVTFATSGSVSVRVVDSNGLPVTNAKVTISGSQNVTLFTGPTGTVSMSGFALGYVAVQAVKDNLAASSGGNLASHSQPLEFTLNLGASTQIGGFVEAELGVGQPSSGTRVLATVSSRLLPNGALHLETTTDANGRYQFNAIPVGSTVASLGMLGPDDVTQGAAISNYAIPDGTTTFVELPHVKLDATPPRVVNLEPANNANNVSPNSDIVVTFSEQIGPQYLNTDWFQLISTDDNVRVSNATLSPQLGPDGTYIVHIIAPDPTPAQIAAGQKYRLKSNVVYRVVIPAGITDAGGRNGMKNTVGTSFTTVNYTEPSIVRIDPAVDTPLPQQTTFRVKFNKAIDGTSFNPGNGGVLKLEQLDTYKGAPIATITVTEFVDPADPTTLVVAPTGTGIVESSFYRLTIAKTRDTQTPTPNVQSVDRIFDYYSFDTKKPVPAIESPVPAGFPLISGIAYTATATVYDENTTTKSSDVASVDWFDANGNFLVRVKTAPFGYTFVAPPVNADGTPTKFTLKANATDLSGNTSASMTAFTWDVAPNNAPSDLAVTSTPSSIYPGGSTTTSVAFNDEGLQVTVGLDINAKNTDDSDYHAVISSKKITRAKVDDPWTPATFTYTIPTTVKDGTATITATATDSAAHASTKTANLTILADTAVPQVVSIKPLAEAHYKYKDVYTIELKVKDAETGVAKVVFAYDGKSVPVTTGSTDANGVRTFTTSVTVPPKNADTRIHIVATAYDYRDNTAVATTDVIYDSVNDAEIPKAVWITPLDGAALPNAQTNWTTTLRVRATDNIKVTQVKFSSSALASPAIVLNPKSGTIDIFEAAATLTMPADLSPFTITATISDDDPIHDVELPITIDPVHADFEIISNQFAINAGNVASYMNKSVLLRGGGSRLFITVPVTLKNLMVLDGAVVSNPDQTKIDVTIGDRLFVDADSAIDVTAKGYLGGWVSRDDNSSRNNSRFGMTLGASGATTTGGAYESASYAGIGGESPAGPSNATYGSITNPIDLGSGGGGSNDGHETRGGSGGGAALLRGATGASDLARFVVAGAIRADGGSGVGVWAAGSGGSVLMTSRTLITGPNTRVSANGGDEDAGNNGSLGGGGGRVSVIVGDRFDYADLTALLSARGGRNGSSAEGKTYLDGGAGTIYVKKPGAANGDLIVSSYDSRYPASTHQTKGTPLAGTLTFDTFTVGPRALARLDSDITLPSGITPVVDPTALLLAPTDVPSIALASTTPAADGSVIQNTPIVSTFNAGAIDGIDHVRAILSASTSDAISSFGDHPAALNATNISTTVPATATVGGTTLKLRAVSRSGRSVETVLTNFSIVANTAPVITQFDTTPASGQMFPGHSFGIIATATDDVAVTSLGLTSTLGTVTSTPPVVNGSSRTQNFSVAISNTAAAGSVTLTLSASDAFPGRADTTQAKTVTILADTFAPSVTITGPTTTINEQANGTFAVTATIVDNEVGVKRAYATWEGQTYDLSLVSGQPNTYTATLPIPDVDGVDPVAKPLTVTAIDFADNTFTTPVKPVNIQPLIDPAAPTMAWICGSPNAMFPAGYTVKFRVSAVGASQANGVSKVEVSVNGAAPIAAPSVGTNLYEASYQIPAGTAAGSVLSVVASATSTSNNKATLTTNITVVSGTAISTAVSVDATSATLEGATIIINSGGTLTVTGPHHFGSVAVLDGGTMTVKQTDIMKPDALLIDNLFVACNAVVDSNAAGFKRSSTYPGSGTPGDSSGGGHMGRGGVWGSIVGGTFGSIYRPLEGGGGGQIGDPAYDGTTGGAGGGIVRIIGTNVTIDGTVRANAREAATWGAGAGGSVYITATKLAGGGKAEANGATWSGGTANNRGAGGGGAVAIEYDSASGNIISNLAAIGGVASGQGAAGTAYAKSTAAPFGDLTVSNGTRSSSLAAQTITELPSFGIANVVSSPSAGTAVLDSPWEGPYLAGSYLRVYAPDGTTRGTWGINTINNDASVRSVDGMLAVPLQAVAYDGYLMYSDNGYGASAAHVLPVRNNAGIWQYDNGSTFTNFTPAAGDKLFASFSKSTTSITALQTFQCGTACSPVAGLPALALVRGGIAINATIATNSCCPVDQLAQANNRIILGRDDDYRGIVLSGGAATVTLASGADVRAGDTVRGVYQFDHVTIKNARVYSRDLVVSTTAASVDPQSTFVPGNPAAPVVDPSKIAYTAGANGPIITGSAGAITGTTGPIDVIVRNNARSVAPVQWTTNGDAYFDSNKNGLTVRKTPNGVVWGGYAWTTLPGSSYAYIQAKSAQTNQQWDLLLTATPGNAEYDWGAFNNGTCQVWVNNSPVTGTFSYNTNTLFRIERTPTNVYFLLDGVVKYTATIDSRPRYGEVAFRDDNCAANSVEFGADAAVVTYPANSDGSFSIPIVGTAGDAITISGRDRHVFFPLTSAPKTVAAIPNIGLASLTFNPSDAVGGRTAVATVTLLGPAGAQGALVSLTKSDNVATMPATVTVPANATSVNFNITTTPLTGAAIPVTITATYGGITKTSLLNVVKDNVPPSISITSPAANATYTEGSGTKIPVVANVTDADSGVARVFATIDGVSTDLVKDTTKGPNAYSGNVNSPYVDGTTPVVKGLTVTALDNSANSFTTDPVNLNIAPITDSNPPAVSWACTSPGAMYPVGYTAHLRLIAKAPSATNVIQNVVITVTDPSGTPTPYTASAVTGAADNYEVNFVIPNVADGSVYNISAVATAASGSQSSIPSTLVVATNVTAITTNTTITETDHALDGKSIAVYSPTSTPVELTIAGAHSYARLLVLSNGRVSHAQGITTFDVTTTTTTYVACDGSIDATARGYSGNFGYVGEGAASRDSGASHIGIGARDDGSGGYSRPGTSYGSIKRPQELGGGGGLYGGMVGGGRLHLIPAKLIVDGAIRANGNDPGNIGGGAGGSVWIAAGRISGEGVIEARGSKPGNTPGGGGAIAIEYTDATSSGKVLTTLTTQGSTFINNRISGAGSIYVKTPSTPNGTLTIDNGTNTAGNTELPAFGSRTVTALTSGGARVSGEHWLGPYLVGHEVQIATAAGVSKGMARVTAIDNGWYRFVEASEWYLCDGCNESGYLMYSEATTGSRGIGNGPGGNHWLPVAFVSGQWRYENNGGFGSAFTPQSTDRIFASFTMSGYSWSFTPMTCPDGVCATINGIQTAEALRGYYEPNAVVDSDNDGELTVRNILMKDGLGPDVKLEMLDGSPLNLQTGDIIRGVYRFDALNVPHGETIVSNDELRINGITQVVGPGVAGRFVEYVNPIVGDNVVVSGNISTTAITANSLTVAAGAVLSHPVWSVNPTNAGLTLNINGPVTVAGTIDVSGRGYSGNWSYPGEPAASRGSGGGHIGRGGFDNGAGPSGVPGTSYGSVKHPVELGGGGGYWGSMVGGGRLRVISKSLQVDGAIRANGQDASQGGAAGGSIWITSDKVTGNGTIEARGSFYNYTPGGGGAIAIEYTDASSGGNVFNTLNTKTNSNGRPAGAGSIFVKGPTTPNGTLTIDNGSLGGNGTTELPSFGNRIVTALNANGAARVTGTHYIGPYLVGHEVEVFDSAGASKGIGRISSIDNGWYRTFEAQEWYLCDGCTESGYLMYSEPTTGSRGIGNGPGGNHWLPVAFVSGQWRYENNGGFGSAFTPLPTDRIFATFTMSGYSWSFAPIDCTGGCPTINGIQTAEVIHARYEPNAVVDSGNDGELVVRDLLLKDGLSPEVKLESVVDGTPMSLQVGDVLRGMYRFDAVNIAHGENVISYDAIKVNGTTQIIGPTAAGQFIEYTEPVVGTDVVVKGNISLTSVTANSLTIAPGAVLSHPSWYSNPANAGLNLNISGTLTVSGSIDVSGRGYSGNWSYPAEPAGSRGSGGSHMGRGGFDNGAGPSGAPGGSYGNLKQPVELGGGGGYWSGMIGGGRLRINTQTLQVDGSIRANGQDASQGGAAGGSIWITAQKVLGNGSIEARGSLAGYTPGGGGAIALEYTDAASSGSVLATLNTKTNNNGRPAGAGSIFVKGPGATYGSLTVDNGSITGGTTELPSFGARVVTDLTASGGAHVTGDHYLGPYLVGNEVEVTSASGASKGVGRITAIDNGWYRTFEPQEWYLCDGCTESGYLMYSEQTTGSRGIGNGPGGNHWLPVAFVSGQWRYENNGGFGSTFTPLPTDRIFASFTMNGYSWTFTSMSCPDGVCATINGIQTAEVLHARYEPNAVVDSGNDGELVVRDLLIKDGLSPEVKIESVTGTPITLAVGDKLRGIYRFDGIKVRSSRLQTLDRLTSTTAIDTDASSQVLTNTAAPAFNPSLLSSIRVVSDASGDRITAPAGAVSDTDTPIRMTARNSRTGALTTVNAAADGSFTIAVNGNIGDTFTVFATDSNAIPLSSETVNVNGAIVNTNGITAFTIDPATVAGGSTAAVTVRLQFAARTGGVPITLTTSDASVFPLPSTVTVAEGSVSAQFLVVAGSPAATSNVTLSATSGLTPQSAAVTVVPGGNRIVSIALSSPTTQGGTSVNGTVTLGANAPAGGAVVLLASSDSSVAGVPPSIVIPEGTNAATFTVSTAATGATVNASISATWGATLSAPLTVTACGTMSTPATPAIPSGDNVWIEDAAPSGATATPSGSDVFFTGTQFAAGSASLMFRLGATSKSWTMTTTTTFSVGASDQLTNYILVNPCNPPREVLFIWSDGAAEYRYSYGEDVIDTTVAHKRIGPMPAGGSWIRQTVLASAVGANGKAMRSLIIKVNGGEVWIDHIGTSACTLTPNVAPPALNPYEVLWFDEVLPAGAVTRGLNGVVKPWITDSTQAASGATSHTDGLFTATHEHVFDNATDKLAPKAGDVLFTYVLLDPCNPPREVMLEFWDGSRWAEAIWGEDVALSGTSKWRVGPLPETGKWVRLEVPASLLQLEGAQVTGFSLVLYDGRAWFDRTGRIPRVNLAVGKSATQSSNLNNDPVNFGAQKAVDGNSNGNYNTGNSITHTLSDANAWWQVDLGSVQPIDNIVLYNRLDCCPDRLQNFYVFVSDDPFTSTNLATTIAQPGVSAYRVWDQSPSQLTLSIQRTGRYVRVQLTGTNYLTLAEVQVWAPATAKPVNVAGGRSASQVSTYGSPHSFPPELAVNGLSSTSWALDFAMTANGAASDWWELDLGSVQPVSQIDVWNRTDAAGDRLQNFYVFVSDVPFTAKDIATTLAQPGVGVYYYGAPQMIAYPFAINRTARYVRVQLSGANWLQLQEVQVWSRGPALKSLAAPSTPQ